VVSLLGGDAVPIRRVVEDINISRDSNKVRAVYGKSHMEVILLRCPQRLVEPTNRVQKVPLMEWT
jgi:hypothetical protein